MCHMAYNKQMDSTQTLALTDISKGLTQEYVLLNSSGKKTKGPMTFSIAQQAFLNQFLSVFFFLLLACAYLAFWLGWYVDAAIFLGVNVINIFTGFLRDFHVLKSIKKIEGSIVHFVTVLRDGTFKQIRDFEVLKGDIIMLAPGQVLAVDVLVRQSIDAFADQSAHTGKASSTIVEEGTTLLAGTALLAGRVIGQAILDNEANALIKYSTKFSGVKKQDSFATFVSKINFYVLVTTLLALTLLAIFSVYITDIYEAPIFILFGIALLIGVVPESLLSIISLMLTRESLVLLKENIIIKKFSALQLLGSIKYFFVDKTGNLADDEARIADVVDVSDLEKVATRIALSEYPRSASDASLDESIRQHFSLITVGGLPLETINVQDKPEVIPYSDSLGYAQYDFKDITIIRGQFRKIIDLCGYRSNDLDNAYVSYELRGLRVIALATSLDKQTFTLAGLLVLEDSIKPDEHIPYDAVKDFGIETKIITSDSPLVATYIAQKFDSTLDAKNVYAMDAIKVSQLTVEDIDRAKVYARCLVDQKFNLINLHATLGTVGFLAEGIEDSNAIRRADIGMVVGTANDAAVQSADILFGEKGLGPVVRALQMSRRVYTQIYTYLLCTLVGNIGSMFSIMAVAVLWNSLPMLPVQILLSSLLTGIPFTFIITDHLMKEQYNKPANHNPWPFFRTIIIFGLLVSCLHLIYFLIFYKYPIESLRTGWFVLDVITKMLLILSLRTRTTAWGGRVVAWPLTVSMMVSVLLALYIPYAPYINNIFVFVPLKIDHLNIILGMGIVFFFINESVKKFIGKFASIS